MNTYIHAYMQTYIHIHIHAYIHLKLLSSINNLYKCTYNLHTYIHAYIPESRWTQDWNPSLQMMMTAVVTRAHTQQPRQAQQVHGSRTPWQLPQTGMYVYTHMSAHLECTHNGHMRSRSAYVCMYVCMCSCMYVLCRRP